MDRKEEIILATLELASKSGLGNVSLSQIADKIGIKKESLYNHFKSKEDIVDSMYEYLREAAKRQALVTNVDYGEIVKGRQAEDVLFEAVNNYLKIIENDKLMMFYKVIYSERTHSKEAANILLEENEKMILATKQLFYAIEVHGLLNFKNVDMEALAFAMTIHSMIDFHIDSINVYGEGKKAMIEKYIKYYCNQKINK